eukprot:COSAG01_NODE_695_length_14201_cov_10.521875_15_plen_185_part_00
MVLTRMGRVWGLAATAPPDRRATCREGLLWTPTCIPSHTRALVPTLTGHMVRLSYVMLSSCNAAMKHGPSSRPDLPPSLSHQLASRGLHGAARALAAPALSELSGGRSDIAALATTHAAATSQPPAPHSTLPPHPNHDDDDDGDDDDDDDGRRRQRRRRRRRPCAAVSHPNLHRSCSAPAVARV